MVLIVVTGAADTRIPAERGRVAVRIEAVGDARDDVLERATARHSALTTQARVLADAGAVTEWDAADITLASFTEWTDTNPQKQVKRLRAQARLTLTFEDFAALGSWCLDAASQEDVAIDHVTWDLTRERRAAAEIELRTNAARDAVTRAASYAGALGLPAPRLTALYEDGLRPASGGGGGGGGGGPMYAMRAAAFDSAGGGVDLQPQDIDLAVAVSADFEV